MNDDAAATAKSLFPDLPWLTCMCGALTARVPCQACAEESGSKVEAAAARARRRAEQESSIPAEYANARLSDPQLASRVKSTTSLPVLVRLAHAAERLVVLGGAGAGKSSLVVAGLRELDDGGGFYVSALSLASANLQHGTGKGVAPLVTRAVEARVTAIDDVGGPEHRQTSNGVIDVVWERHAKRRPTWIVCLPKDRYQLAALYGDGFARRVFERALVIDLNLTRPTGPQ